MSPPVVSRPLLPYPQVTYSPLTPTQDLALAVVDRGVRMPAYEAVPVAPPEVIEVPAPAPVLVPAPPVPVYPRKQDRN